MVNDVKFFKGSFWQEQADGTYRPIPIPMIGGGGGGGGLSRSSVLALIQQFGGGGSGDTFQNATFMLDASGGAGSGTVDGDATKVSYNAGTKTFTFITAKQLKLAHINTLSDTYESSSYGKDDGILADCFTVSSDDSGNILSAKSKLGFSIIVITTILGSPDTFIG